MTENVPNVCKPTLFCDSNKQKDVCDINVQDVFWHVVLIHKEEWCGDGCSLSDILGYVY